MPRLYRKLSAKFGPPLPVECETVLTLRASDPFKSAWSVFPGQQSIYGVRRQTDDPFQATRSLSRQTDLTMTLMEY